MENNNIILLCNNGHYDHYFKEYINSLGIDFILYNENIYKYDEIYNLKKKILVFVRKIPLSIDIERLSGKIIYLLNTEQNTKKMSVKMFYKNLNLKVDLLNKGVKFLDYSLMNINYYKDNIKSYSKSYYIPYQFNDKEVLDLQDKLEQKKVYDVAFCSVNSERREYIFNELEKNGIKCINVIGWGSKRDKLIAKAKILINIHKHNDFNIYETIRCDRWIFSKMLVVTENSYNDELNDIKELLIIEIYDNIVNKIIDIVNNYDLYYDLFLQKYKENIDIIKSNRQKHLFYCINGLIKEYMLLKKKLYIKK